VPLLVWVITFDLTGKGDPNSKKLLPLTTQAPLLRQSEGTSGGGTASLGSYIYSFKAHKTQRNHPYIFLYGGN